MGLFRRQPSDRFRSIGLLTEIGELNVQFGGPYNPGFRSGVHAREIGNAIFNFVVARKFHLLYENRRVFDQPPQIRAPAEMSRGQAKVHL